MASMRSWLTICLCSCLVLSCYSTPDIQEEFKKTVLDKTEDVRTSIRHSLLTSIPAQHQNKKVSNVLPEDKIRQLEEFLADIQSRVATKEEIFASLAVNDLALHSKSGLGNIGLLDFVEALMKGIMSALEVNMQDIFVALVTPLVDLAVAMSPLPEYQYTSTIMDGSQEMRYIEETFENWGSTLLANVTVRTFFPRTVAGIQNIVKAAGKEGARVRASATRHTFNPWLWGVESNLQPGTQGHNVDYVIAMLPLEISDHLAYARDHGSWPEDSDLVYIEGPLDIWEEEGKKHAAVKFGASTLNLHYYDWALANNWTMPANTIMHYMSIGGVALGTCHGGGIGHQTIADRIIEMEIVDSNGELQVINDPQHLKVAAGSMGMLGVVTSITYKLDEMSYARYQPQHAEGGITAVLPPPGEPVPEETITHLTHYYSEFIQYPGHHGAPGLLWLQTWDNLGRAEDAVTIIDHTEDEFERATIFLEDVGNKAFKTILEYFNSEEYLYWLFGWMSGQAANIAMMDFDEPIVTTATEAMHFQRGLHYLTVKAAELIVPIPELENGEPDWRIVQEVVYDLKSVHDDFLSRDLYPNDLAMEARMMAGSELLMAAQYGNKYSLAIEVASSPLVPEHLWEEFKNAIAANWKNYYDREGNQLKVRPHWAKEVPHQVGDQDIYEYMREVYSDQIPAFVEGMKDVMKFSSTNITATLNMFSTKYLENIFEGYF